MSDYGSDEYSRLLSQGEVGEEEVLRLLIDLEFYPVKNITKTWDGRITWQQVCTRFGNKRNLDFDIFANKNGKVIFKVESKQLSRYHRVNTNKYLTIEKAKFDDYLMVQSDTELDCYIFFLVGVVENNKFPYGYSLHWDNLFNIQNSIVDCGFPYPNSSTECYIIDKTKLLNKENLVELVLDHYFD